MPNTAAPYLIFDIASDRYFLKRQGWVRSRDCATRFETKEDAAADLAIVKSCGGKHSAVVLPVGEAA